MPRIARFGNCGSQTTTSTCRGSSKTDSPRGPGDGGGGSGWRCRPLLLALRWDGYAAAMTDAAAATLRRTPLHDSCAELGAKLVPFAGWEMPVTFEGVREEHTAV